jgi:hypothetical protein
MTTLFNPRTLIFLALTLLFGACAKDIEDVDVFGSISGIVRDAQHQPIAGVSVSLQPGGATKTTGTDGAYEFSKLDQKVYTLTFTKSEYISVSKEITTQAGMNTPLDITLDREQLLSVTPASLDFGAITIELQLTLEKKGTSAIDYTVEKSNDWIIPEKLSGKLTATDYLKIMVNRESLSPRDYSGSVTIRAGAEVFTIPVRMNVPANEKPSVSIDQPRNITGSGATFSGMILSIGKDKVTQHGFCWSASAEPTVSDNSTNLGDCSAPKSFEFTASGLQPGTTYNVRAYAQNSAGIAYSSTISFATAAQSLTVSPASIDAAAAAGTYTFTISGNASWTVSSNQSWCTVTPASGTGDATITVSAAANATTSTRTATLTVAAGTLSRQVTVQQQAKKDVHTSFAITFDSYVNHSIDVVYNLGGSNISSSISALAYLKTGYVFQEGEKYSIRLGIVNYFSDHNINQILYNDSYGVKLSLVKKETVEGLISNDYYHYLELDLTALDETALDNAYPSGKAELRIDLK